MEWRKIGADCFVTTEDVMQRHLTAGNIFTYLYIKEVPYGNICDHHCKRFWNRRP